ncbi:MAG: rhodanese-like domain-containing protein [Comamonadaceae bacterium]|nr:rhodanese-like domain-containing protein [Comamonadaceae bacterium]
MSALPASSVLPARRRLVCGLAAAALCAAALPASAAGADEPLPLEAARDALARGDALVFDIREPAEHARGVAPGIRLLPMSRIDDRLSEIPKDPAQPVLLVCQTQNRSRAVARAARARLDQRPPRRRRHERVEPARLAGGRAALIARPLQLVAVPLGPPWRLAERRGAHVAPRLVYPRHPVPGRNA